MRAAYDRWQASTREDGLDPVEATIVRLVADGLWLGDMFGFAPIAEPLRTAVIDHLRHRSCGVSGSSDNPAHGSA